MHPFLETFPRPSRCAASNCRDTSSFFPIVLSSREIVYKKYTVECEAAADVSFYLHVCIHSPRREKPSINERRTSFLIFLLVCSQNCIIIVLVITVSRQPMCYHLVPFRFVSTCLQYNFSVRILGYPCIPYRMGSSAILPCSISVPLLRPVEASTPSRTPSFPGFRR